MIPIVHIDESGNFRVEAPPEPAPIGERLDDAQKKNITFRCYFCFGKAGTFVGELASCISCAYRFGRKDD
jgi:hypothetical protein